MTSLPEIPVIETDRLRLRAPEGRDYPAYRDFRLSDRAWGVGGPYSESEAFVHFGELLGHWAIRGFGRWIVADRSTDAALGVVGLYHPPDWPEPEIAWMLFGTAEGKGIAAEAALAARDHAYGTLGWTTAVSLIIPGNDRSIALARRMGCTRDPDFPHPDLGRMEVWRHPGPEARP
jgi:ribosomal-protein-alanine N-acetyltransferase